MVVVGSHQHLKIFFFLKCLQSEAIESKSSLGFMKGVGWWWSGPTTTSGSSCLYEMFAKWGISHAPLHEECLKLHGHKGDVRVRPGTCGDVGEKAPMILV